MWKVVIAFMALACSSPAVYAGEEEAISAKSKAMAHFMMAVVHDLDGNPKEAITEYLHSVEANPKEPLPHLRLAAYYTRAGLLDESIRELKTVLIIDPQNSQARYLLALVYSSQKKYDLAAQEYENMLKNASSDDPGNLEVYIYLAQLYYSQGKYPQAIAQFNRILAIQEENVSANYLLGTAYLETNEREKARGLFKKTLLLDPNHDGAMNSLAYMYAEDNINLDDALKMTRKAIEIDPTNGAYYDTLGWVLHKQGKNAESLMALQKAENFTPDPIIYDHMGDVYFAVNEFTLARKFWQKSLDLESDQPQIKAKIEELGKTQARQ